MPEEPESPAEETNDDETVVTPFPPPAPRMDGDKLTVSVFQR